MQVYKCKVIQVHKYTSIQHDIRDLGLSEWVLAKTWQSLRCKRVIKHKSKSIKNGSKQGGGVSEMQDLDFAAELFKLFKEHFSRKAFQETQKVQLGRVKQLHISAQ